ncbi:MAG TPA: AAA family ATPase [Trebonia sp.]|nr:AAA family ATPase [Trebonia sp.]
MTENQQLPEGELYGEEVPTFNTAGPCIPQRHYMLPPEPRVPGALYLVDFDEYFVIHAPRQTGKTTVLEALARDINAAGQRVALVFSCEQAAPAGDNYDAAIDALLATITDEARAHGLAPEQMPPSPWPDGPPEVRLRRGLTAWSQSCPLPIVLLIDEIDTLAGLSLIAVLRQIRAGHNARSRASFPSSVVLDRRPTHLHGLPPARDQRGRIRRS